MQLLWLAAVEQCAHGGNEVARIETRHKRRPARANAVGAVDEQRGHHRRVEVWLDWKAVVVQIVEHGVVLLREEKACHRRQSRVDITSAGSILHTRTHTHTGEHAHTHRASMSTQRLTLPPKRRVPNIPDGYNRLTLLLAT